MGRLQLSLGTQIKQTQNLSRLAAPICSYRDYDKSFGEATWRVHSRSECIRCHNSWAGGVLGFTLSQLNRPVRFLRNGAAETRLSHHSTHSAASTADMTMHNQIEMATPDRRTEWQGP